MAPRGHFVFSDLYIRHHIKLPDNKQQQWREQR